jgi:hypothetical protein
MNKTSTAWLENIKPEQGWYLAGFADGEGSFNVSLRKRSDHTMRWQVILTFNVSQKEEYILAIFKKILRCGRLQARKDGIYYYTVSNPRSVIEKVIPFFSRFQFLSHRKKKNFAIFKEIAKMIQDGWHLNRDGLEKIIRLREELNKGRGRTRKYGIKEYTESLKGNPQRLNAKPRQFRKEITRG